MKFNPNARLDTSQVQDRRSGGGGGGMARMPGGKGGLAVGGGGLGLIVVVVIVLINVFSGGSSSTSSLLGGGSGSASVDNAQLESECKTGADANTNDDCTVVAVINSVQDYWADALAASGTTYREADTVFFNGSTPTGCGTGSTGMGPFYCPPDEMVYIDLSFWNELKTTFGANDAPFTQAYVLAHEYGHHVQNLLGTSDRVRHRDRRHVRVGAAGAAGRLLRRGLGQPRHHRAGRQRAGAGHRGHRRRPAERRADRRHHR